MMQAEGDRPSSPLGTREPHPTSSTPLMQELAATATSYLQPSAVFVSWHGVLTLAFSGFPPALLDLKRRISAAHPALPPESSGSKWPKTSLGCLEDGATLSPEDFDMLSTLCKSYSASTFGAGDGGGAAPIKIAVDSAAVAVYENCCLERLLSLQVLPFYGGHDGAEPGVEERARVLRIAAEVDDPGYYELATKAGHRAAHYVGPALGVTLMHPLLVPPGRREPGSGPLHEARAGLQERGVQELADRRRLMEAVAEFRGRVEEALPRRFRWFADESLHVTLRALILPGH